MSEPAPNRLLNQERRGNLIFFQVTPGVHFFDTVRERHCKFKPKELSYNEESGEFYVSATTAHHVQLLLINDPDYKPEVITCLV